MAHCVTGLAASFEEDLDRAKSEIDIALSLNPNLALAHNLLGTSLIYSGGSWRRLLAPRRPQKRGGRKKGSRNVKDADAIQPRPKGRELRLAKDTRGFVADPQQSGLKRASASGRFWA